MLTRSKTSEADHDETLDKPKIDRLSSLPPELLDWIFDLAYPLGSPSTGPLSKHLLPYHILGLYRRIKLATNPPIGQLVKKILSDPPRGSLVQEAVLQSWMDEECVPDLTNIGETEKFFQAMPKLQYLDLGEGFSIIQMVSVGLVYPSPVSLTYLRLAGDASPAWYLDELPALETFHMIVEHPDEAKYIDFYVEDSDCFPNLTELSLRGEIDDEPQKIANFFSKIPNLSDLTLEFQSEEYVPHLWPQLAGLLSPALESLDLQSCDGGRPIDHLLPRFTHLKRLSLGEGFFLENIPSYLTQLHALEELHLDRGKVCFTQFCTLLSDRLLPHLETLSLDVINIGKRGESILGEDGLPRRDWIVAEGDLIGNGWELPGFDEQGGFTLEGAKELLKLAEVVEVEIEGQLVEVVAVEEGYRTEVGNVAAYRTFKDKDFRHIHNVRNRFPHWSEWLFDLDLESLDPSKLVLQIYSGGIHGSKPSYRIAGAG